MMFAYTALDHRGERITESLEADSLTAAQQELLRRGLFVLNLEPGRGRKGARKTEGAGAEAPAVPTGRVRPRARGTELVLFTRQMAMMLKAGASIVPAIQAINEQPGRAAWHALLQDLAERVEAGSGLHEAMAWHPTCFPGALRSIVAAGEATGRLADAFVRIAGLLEQRGRIRKRVVSALAYPAVLLVLAIGVIVTMTLFVLPRFAKLFEMLDTPLPALTRLMLDSGAHMRTWWPVVLAVPAGLITGMCLWIRSEGGRRLLGSGLLRVPVIGRALAGVILARLLQTWAALLCSRVSLLDAISAAREITDNARFQKLIADVTDAVTEGRSLSGVLKQSRLVPAPVVSAVAIGEESGRLGESMEFVGSWLQEENDALVNGITRALEPAILAVMGFVVGGVAISLFLPLFDIATAAG